MRRLSLAALVPVSAGAGWLWFGQGGGGLWLVACAIPGSLLLTTGLSALLYPGDLRILQFLTLGGSLGAGLGVAVGLGANPAAGVLLLAASAASFAAAGALAVQQDPPRSQIPVPAPSLRLAAEVAFDEIVLLSSLTLRLPGATADDRARVRHEVAAARALFAARGWLATPETFHRRPAPPTAVTSTRATVGSLSYEHLQFDSDYEPWPEEPGRERWLARSANRRAHAWVLRHGAPRPWLVCVHGYEMGRPHMDFGAFRARRLHDDLGLNLAFPTLPLHGPRRTGRRSGAGYLGPDVIDSLHAEAQAMWDLRRILGWIRERWNGPVGVYGLSLGGYTAALLASLEPLDLVIAGVPAVDFRRLTLRHAPPLDVRATEGQSEDRRAIRDVLAVVSPLSLPPKVSHAGRAIFAGVADQIVPPDHARDLWIHWDRPTMVWYEGGHVSFRRHPSVDRLIDDTLGRAGLLSPSAAGPLRAGTG